MPAGWGLQLSTFCVLLHAVPTDSTVDDHTGQSARHNYVPYCSIISDVVDEAHNEMYPNKIGMTVA